MKDFEDRHQKIEYFKKCCQNEYEKSLKLLEEFLETVSDEELKEEIKKVERLNIESTPVDEYFKLLGGLNEIF